MDIQYDALIWFQMVSIAYNDALISYIHTKIASNHAEVCIIKDFFTTGRASSYSFGMNEVLLSKVSYNGYYSE
jgi:hypothetical protein